MVRVLIFSVSVLLAATACTDNSAKQPFFRKPITVVIEKNAAWEDFVSSEETPAMCKDYVLTEDDVKEYFHLARLATEREYSHDLLMSRCFAEGTITMPGKHKGKWRIDRTRRGILMLETGQSYFFYCGKCISRVYTEPCDIDCIHGN